MVRRTFSAQERAFITAHQFDAEDSLKGMIDDLRTAKRRFASYQMGFESIAQFITEANKLPDEKKRSAALADIISVCKNFSQDSWPSLKSLQVVEGFEHEVKRKGRGVTTDFSPKGKNKKEKTTTRAGT
jgi:hypothetical protein